MTNFERYKELESQLVRRVEFKTNIVADMLLEGLIEKFQRENETVYQAKVMFVLNEPLDVISNRLISETVNSTFGAHEASKKFVISAVFSENRKPSLPCSRTIIEFKERTETEEDLK